MKKLITVFQVVFIAVLISSLAFAEQIIQATEPMVGAHHATLPDTLNRGFLIQHNAEGVHTIVPWAALTGVPTTFPWDNLSGKPTTLSGYGITDAAGAITSFPYDNITGKPTTFPYDNLTGVPLTFPYDNLTGVPAAGGGTTNASDLTSGLVAKARGGWGADISAASGLPFFDNGTITWDTLITFFARFGITFNPADNTITFGAEITVPQLNTTCSPGDNTCFWNAGNNGDRVSPNPGDCWFNFTLNKMRCMDNTSTVVTIGPP